jgi:hypothetical protein
VSFKVPHFHELIAYFENEEQRPPIDTVLQQLFRVRQLIDGKMTIFVHNTKSLKVAQHLESFPMIPEEVDDHLDKTMDYVNTSLVNFQVGKVYDRELKKYAYDQKSLSYAILRGILINRNKSFGCFTGILKHTLKKDYKIPVSVVPLESENKDEIMKAVKVMKALRALRTTEEFMFDENLLISEAEFDELDKTRKRGEPLNELQTQQHWTWSCAIELWSLPSIRSVDEEFFEKYIGQANSRDKKNAFAKYFQALRHRDLLNDDLSKHAANFQNKMDDIKILDQHSIELYKTKTKEHYMMLMTGHALMEKLKICLTDLTSGNEIKLTGDKVHTAMRDYLRPMKLEEYESLMSVFDKKKHYGNKKKLMQTDASLTYLMKRILGDAFGITVDSDNQNHKEAREKTIVSPYNDLKKYNPGFMMPPLVYMFNSEDDEDDDIEVPLCQRIKKQQEHGQ